MLRPAQGDASPVEKLDGGLENLAVFFQNNKVQLGPVSGNSGGCNFKNPVSGKRDTSGIFQLKLNPVFSQKAVIGVAEYGR